MFPLLAYNSFWQLSKPDRITFGRFGSNQQLFELPNCHRRFACLL
jgi:hypothetical protein